MNTDIIHHQFRIALLDIQELNKIAARIEEGASSDVMEVLASNIGSVNERQGIDSEPLEVVSLESFTKQKELALESIGESLKKLWAAVYKAISSFVNTLKEKIKNFTNLFRNEVTVLKQTRNALAKLDPKATFVIKESDKYALQLANANGDFKISEAAKGLSRYANFVSEFIDAFSKGNKVFEDLMKKIMVKNDVDVATAVILDFGKLSSMATIIDFSRSSDPMPSAAIEYDFGGKTTYIDSPPNFLVNLSSLEDVDIGVKKTAGLVVNIVDDAPTVADAVNMMDAAIHALETEYRIWDSFDKLDKTLLAIDQETGEMAKNQNFEDDSYLLAHGVNECIKLCEMSFGFIEGVLYDGVKAVSAISKYALKAEVK